jgi:hypothetical protein
MGINDEKEKSQRLRRIEDFISYLSFKSSVLSRGIHWVSWCSANHQKYIPPPKTHVRSDISAPLTGFQRIWLDMSGPRPDMSGPQAKYVRPLSLFPI